MKHRLTYHQFSAAVCQKGAALERAAKLAACHHFLARVATLFETDAADRFVIQHLRHKSVLHRRAQQRHAAHHLQPGPQRGFQRRSGRLRCAGACQRGQPERAPQAQRRWQPQPVAAVVWAELAPGLLGQRRSAMADHAPERERGAGVAELDLGAQHEHRQAFECGGQQVAAANQQNVVLAELAADETGQHAAFRRAQRGQPRLRQIKQCKVLRQLAVQKRGRIAALGAQHAPLGQGRDAAQAGGI